MTSTTHKTHPAPAAADKGKTARQFVNFFFLKASPEFRRLLQNEKIVAKQEFLDAVEHLQDKMILLPYSLTGLRADCDLMFWRVSQDLETLQNSAHRLLSAGLGKYLTPAYSYLAMTKRSTYVDKLNPEHEDMRQKIVPGKHKYLFVYPFVKTRAWHMLPLETRQKLMDEHIRIGNKYPSVKLNTTYSFGLDDQEFVVAFETDSPQDFLDLVQELRGAKSSEYTLRDTPTFTCVAKDIRELVDLIG